MLSGGLAAGAFAGNAAISTLGHNREAWMTDIQLTQSRQYQRHQLRLSTVEMFREDIRDLAGASVTRLNNFVIVATLLLGMVTTCYLSGAMPGGAAKFVICAYMLCIASSLLYLVFSVMCAVSASNLATQCQKDLLVNLVRLPTKELAAEVEHTAAQERVHAFEDQSLTSMFRMPGLNKLTELVGTGVLRTDSRLEHRDTIGNRMSQLQSLREEEEYEERMQNLMSAKVDNHLALFHERETQWEVLGQLGYLFGGMGLSHLLQAYSYYSAMKYYEGNTWSSIAVPCLLMILDAAMMHTYLLSQPYRRAIGALTLIVGPLACSLAMRTPWKLEVFFIPLCYCCHVVWNCLLAMRIYDIVGDAPGHGDFDGAHDSFEDGLFCNTASAAAGRRQSISGFTSRPMGLRMLPFGAGIVIMAWSCTLAWSINEVAHDRTGVGFAGIGIPSSRRLLEASAFPQMMTAKELAVEWPVADFRPHATACGSDGACFLASAHALYRFGLSADLSLQPEPCDVSGEIVDVAAFCEADRCHPWVLMQHAGGTSVVECDTGRQEPLLQDADATGLMASSGGTILTVHGQRVVQRGRGEPHAKGWLPLWPVAEALPDTLAAVGISPVSEDLVLFYSTGHMELLDAESSRPCNLGVLPDEAPDVLIDASVAGSGAAVALLTSRGRSSHRGDSNVELWRIEAPWLSQRCGSA